MVTIIHVTLTLTQYKKWSKKGQEVAQSLNEYLNIVLSSSKPIRTASLGRPYKLVAYWPELNTIFM